MSPFGALTILDLTHVLAGPYATYQFALHGADVIKVESPDRVDCARGRGVASSLAAQGLGLNYIVQAANKRALAIDLADDDARDAFLALVDKADVLVENYRPGALDRLGLGYDALAKRNPGLVYCSITGFGGEGPSARDGAYDNVIQATSGMMAATGGDHAPIKCGASVVDYFTGMAAAFAISAALHTRTASGKGQHVRCSMVDCAMATMAPEIAAHMWQGERRSIPREAGLQTYATADGLLMLGAFTPHENSRLWTLLGEPALADTPDWLSLWEKSSEMSQVLTERLAMRSAQEWEAMFNAAGVPARMVRDADAALSGVDAQGAGLAGRQFLSGRMALPGEMPATLPLAPYRLGEGGAAIYREPPLVGQDSDDVLREAGIDQGRIERLRAKGAVS